jgi:hypothetical protein
LGDDGEVVGRMAVHFPAVAGGDALRFGGDGFVVEFKRFGVQNLQPQQVRQRQLHLDAL